MSLTGNTFWNFAYSNGSQNIKSQPRELWMMDPRRVSVKRGGALDILGYEYTNEVGQKIDLRPNEVIHFHDFNPANLNAGMGQVKPAAISLDIDQYASEHNRNFFYNSALPSMTLKTEQTLTDEKFERLEQKWQEKFQGIRNAHRPAVLEGGLKANILSHTN